MPLAADQLPVPHVTMGVILTSYAMGGMDVFVWGDGEGFNVEYTAFSLHKHWAFSQAMYLGSGFPMFRNYDYWHLQKQQPSQATVWISFQTSNISSV